MTKQQFIELYGKSVYQVRLEAAVQLMGSHEVKRALREADRLIATLMEEDYQLLVESYDGKEATRV